MFSLIREYEILRFLNMNTDNELKVKKCIFKDFPDVGIKKGSFSSHGVGSKIGYSIMG